MFLAIDLSRDGLDGERFRRYRDDIAVGDECIDCAA